jgi:HAD superfamily hydrolase (TIGR01509 family)
MTENRFKAVIFDMDGVLVDSEPVHFESTVRVMGRFGLPFTDADNRRFIGSTDRVMFDVLKRMHGLDNPIDDLIEMRKAVYLELIQNGALVWREGIRDLIAELAGRQHTLAVASSGLKRIIEYTLNRGEIRDHFQAVVSADDIPAPKPSPEIYLEAARRIGIDPAHCAAVEDTDVGVRAAKNAGMYVIAFPTVTTDSMNFEPADVIAKSSQEIRVSLIGNGNPE